MSHLPILLTVRHFEEYRQFYPLKISSLYSSISLLCVQANETKSLRNFHKVPILYGESNESDEKRSGALEAMKGKNRQTPAERDRKIEKTER